jgi:hypothetical protein
MKLVTLVAALGTVAGCAWPPSLPSTPANQSQPVEPVASQAAPLLGEVPNALPNVSTPNVSVPSVSVPRVSVPRMSGAGLLRR